MEGVSISLCVFCSMCVGVCAREPADTGMAKKRGRTFVVLFPPFFFNVTVYTFIYREMERCFILISIYIHKYIYIYICMYISKKKKGGREGEGLVERHGKRRDRPCPFLRS